MHLDCSCIFCGFFCVSGAELSTSFLTRKRRGPVVRALGLHAVALCSNPGFVSGCPGFNSTMLCK